jgi:hypothetical protein
MLKIIILIISYTPAKFHDSYHNIIVDDGKIYIISKFKKNSFFENNNIYIQFVNHEPDPRLW